MNTTEAVRAIQEGDLVWCIGGYDGSSHFPSWPAKIHEMNEEKSSATIHFLGEKSKAQVNIQHLRPFLQTFRAHYNSERCDRWRKIWENGVDEALQIEGEQHSWILSILEKRGFEKRMGMFLEALTQRDDTHPPEHPIIPDMMPTSLAVPSDVTCEPAHNVQLVQSGKRTRELRRELKNHKKKLKKRNKLIHKLKQELELQKVLVQANEELHKNEKRKSMAMQALLDAKRYC